MALLAITGFGVAIAGLAPSAAAQAPCDAVVLPGDSIQAAVDQASPGDAVCVLPGTYDEDVTVDVADLTLSGPNAGVPGDAPHRGLAGSAAEATITGQVILSADGVTFDGFDVSPPPATSNSEGEAVRVSSTPDGVTVQNNVVRDFGEDGLGDWLGVEAIVAFGGDDSDAIEDVAITDNAVHGITGNDVKGGAAGVMIQGNVDGATVTDNVVTDVGEETGWGHGVIITDTGNHDVVPQNVDVSSNTLQNVISSPYDDVYETYGVGVGIETPGTGYVIEDNAIEDNEFGIEVKAGADKVTATDNVISGNSEWGAINKDASTLDATGNWWGCPDGPSDPNCDDVSGDVSVDPWCQDPLCLTT